MQQEMFFPKHFAKAFRLGPNADCIGIVLSPEKDWKQRYVAITSYPTAVYRL